MIYNFKALFTTLIINKMKNHSTNAEKVEMEDENLCCFLWEKCGIIGKYGGLVICIKLVNDYH